MANCSRCCSQSNQYFAKLESILKNYAGKESDLIPLLQDIQEAYGYLSKDVLDKMCEKTGMFPTEVMGVATFYSQFRLEPTGEHIIKVCFGTACHVNGAEKVADALVDELKVKLGSTTADGKFTLETVACLGCCSLAPVMMIDGETYGRLTPDKARNVIREYYATGRA